jgi:tetratricopeptide (TPR) repeat protein
VRLLLAIFVVVAHAPRAEANLWQDVIARAAPDAAAADSYDRELRSGDEHVLQANAESMSLAQRRRQVQLALAAYRAAAAARPSEAEPYFRIAATLGSFYLDSCLDAPHFNITRSPFRDCTQADAIDLKIAQQAVDAWNAAEQRAPLDPRFSGSDGDSVLFERAILNTKLGTPDSLAAAARDYERYLDRSDGKGANLETTWSNLAETYMMLGRLDDSVHAYKEALRHGARTATWYGLAVALDRDGRGALARDVILAQGPVGYRQFRSDVDSQGTFFVPHGEVFYYYALAEEAFGNVDAAIGYWRMYLGSGAHPQFHPRARHHLDALVKRRGRPSPPPDPFLDMR